MSRREVSSSTDQYRNDARPRSRARGTIPIRGWRLSLLRPSVISAPGRLITYTVADLPRKISAGHRGTTFEYDAFDSRALTRTNEFTTHHVGSLFERRDNRTKRDINTFYVFGPSGLIAIVTEPDGGARQTHYQHADHLGTATLITNASGALVSSQFFDPFGRRLNAQLRDAPPGPAPEGTGRRGFTGHRDEGELDLVDMRGRFYDPIARRFLTPDPFVSQPSSSQAWNPYSWVSNLGPNATDPSGLCTVVFDHGDGTTVTTDFPGPCIRDGSWVPDPSLLDANGDLRGSSSPEWRPTERDRQLALEAIGASPTGMAEHGVPARGSAGTIQRSTIRDGFGADGSINWWEMQQEARRLEREWILNNTVTGRFDRALADLQSFLIENRAIVGFSVEMIAGFIPGAGETLDLVVFLSPDSTPGERTLAVISLGASVISVGLLPNFGAIARDGRITDPRRLLSERAGPVGHISPSEVAGRTPAQIDARARELGLSPRGPDPAGGRGAYIDPQTGQQRILSHPNATPPHGHLNNPAGQRIDIHGDVVPPESSAAHLPLGGG